MTSHTQYQAAQRQVRVHRRHRVVGHDAEAAVQALEPVRGIRLDESNTRNRRNPPSAPVHPTGIQEERDQHAHRLRRHDLTGIGAAEMPLGDAAAPAARPRTARRSRPPVRSRDRQEPQRQAGRGSEGAGRHRRVADAERGGDGKRTRGRGRDGLPSGFARVRMARAPSDARTTRVPAKRSWRPRWSWLNEAVRKPRPAGTASTNQSSVAQQRAPEIERSRPAPPTRP